MRFASLLSGGFSTAIVVNPPERKLAKRTSVQWMNLNPSGCLGQKWHVELLMHPNCPETKGGLISESFPYG